MEDYYSFIQQLNSDINKLDQKIDNVGYDNIINHSTVKEMEESVNDIDRRIRIIDKENAKRFCIKNIKLFGKLLHRVYPYVVVAGLVFGGQSLIGDVPFIQQDQIKFAQTQVVLDSDANLEKTKDYIIAAQKNEDYAVTYYTKWELKQDGYYYRTIKKYKLKYYKNRMYNNLLDENNKNKMSDIYDEPYSIDYEKKDPSELTQDEIEKEEYIRYVFHLQDEEDIIIEAQDMSYNLILSGVYLFGAATFITIMYFMRKHYSRFDYYKAIDIVKHSYPEIDIEKLKKLFKAKKIKYEVIKKQQATLTDPIDNKRSIIRAK